MCSLCMDACVFALGVHSRPIIRSRLFNDQDDYSLPFHSFEHLLDLMISHNPAKRILDNIWDDFIVYLNHKIVAWRYGISEDYTGLG